MHNGHFLKHAYDQGQYAALRQFGCKSAEATAEDGEEEDGGGIGALGGAGLGALGGAGIGAGGAALLSILLKKNLMPASVQDAVSSAVVGEGRRLGARQPKLLSQFKMRNKELSQSKWLEALVGNPTSASALTGAHVGLGTGALAGGLYGGLSD